MRKLTIIIPFLNEGIEIENTLRSIRETVGNQVNILLINDASTDGCNYSEVTKTFHSEYYENEQRMGVAASRDLGISMIDTPYFLLLDGHMRFYDNEWATRIVEELEKDERVLLCCQTKVLSMEDDTLREHPTRPASFGASIEFSSCSKFLDPEWIWRANYQLEGTVHDIPCVLGAGYAASKEYWQYLKGLTGLKFYGSDETYISMKVWLEGGRCRLLEDVVIGHIYRHLAPYEFNYTSRLYNKLLIAELLLPEDLKRKLFAWSKLTLKNLHAESCLLLYNEQESILELKNYYQSIFTHDFDVFEQMNRRYSPSIHDDSKNLLENIAGLVIEKRQSASGLSILHGKMGLVLFLFHYAQYTKSDQYQTYANELLEEVYEQINLELPVNFQSGYCGIGWGIQYLFQQGFLSGSASEELADVDQFIMERDPSRINDLSLETGLGGIVLYVLSRMLHCKKSGEIHVFDATYISALTAKVDSVLALPKITDYPSTDIFLRYITYANGNYNEYEMSSIYDIVYPSMPEDKTLNDMPIGLIGLGGFGIRIMLENTNKQ